MPSSNGDEWYRLRAGVQQMMLLPKAASVFLPSVNMVASDFVDRIKRIRDPQTGEVSNFTNEVMKWTIECKYACGMFICCVEILVLNRGEGYWI